MILEISMMICLIYKQGIKFRLFLNEEIVVTSTKYQCVTKVHPPVTKVHPVLKIKNRKFQTHFPRLSKEYKVVPLYFFVFKTLIPFLQMDKKKSGKKVVKVDRNPLDEIGLKILVDFTNSSFDTSEAARNELRDVLNEQLEATAKRRSEKR